MEDLKKLVSIVVKRKQRQYPLLELKSVNENSSKENIFFRYIKRGQVSTDEDAARLLYSASEQDDRYRMLKSRLKQKLLNHLYFLDFSEKHQHVGHQIEQECVQYIHQAKMLMFTDERKIARNLLNKANMLAARGEFTKLRKLSLEHLISLYSENFQPHLYQKALQELKKVRKLEELEEEGRVMFLFTWMMVVKSVNSRKKNLNKTKKVIERLEALWKETRSHNTFEHYYRLRLLFSKLIGDYSAIIPLLQEIEKGVYEKHRLNANRIHRREIVLELLHAYWRSGESGKGLEYANQHMKLFEAESAEWFRGMQYVFINAVAAGKYADADRAIDQVLQPKLLARMPREEAELWQLYEGYLQYLVQDKFISRRVRLQDLLTDIPEYDKNREGFHAAQVIYQFLYYAQKGDAAALTKRRDVLKDYMSNHFKEVFSYRTRTFYKLLNIVLEQELDYRKILGRSRYLVNKLHEVKTVSDAYTEMEIVPYDQLWETLLHRLGEQQGITV
jgi:hypothetical protein